MCFVALMSLKPHLTKVPKDAKSLVSLKLELGIHGWGTCIPVICQCDKLSDNGLGVTKSVTGVFIHIAGVASIVVFFTNFVGKCYKVCRMPLY